MTFRERIQKILDTVDDAITVAVADATNQAFGDIEERVFTTGEDTSNSKIGNYKNTYWKKKREKTGKQTGFVDLTFTGDLKNSVDRNKDTIFFKNQYGTTVGRGNEERYRTQGKIFGFSDNEKKKVFEILQEHVNELFNG